MGHGPGRPRAAAACWSPASKLRFRKPETLRLFALERLAESGSAEATRRAYASYFRQLAEEAGAVSTGGTRGFGRIVSKPSNRPGGGHGGGLPTMTGQLRWISPSPCGRIGMPGGANEVRWPTSTDCWRLSTPPRTPSGGPGRCWWQRTWRPTRATCADLPWAREAVRAFASQADVPGRACALTALGSALGGEGALHEAARISADAVAAAQRLCDDVLIARALNRQHFVTARRGDAEHAEALVAARDRSRSRGPRPYHTRRHPRRSSGYGVSAWGDR